MDQVEGLLEHWDLRRELEGRAVHEDGLARAVRAEDLIRRCAQQSILVLGRGRAQRGGSGTVRPRQREGATLTPLTPSGKDSAVRAARGVQAWEGSRVRVDMKTLLCSF